MKRGMLFVSFGTSYAETRAKTIDAIEAKVRAAYPTYTLYSAWTSNRIIEKVRAERGELHDTLEEALERMEADGVDDLIVSTTCLMEGHEMTKIRAAVVEWAAARGCPARIADPLLATPDDCAALARCVADAFSFVGESDVLLLMGHGSRSASDSVYAQVETELHKLGCRNFFVATVEGARAFGNLWSRVKAGRPACVYLAPLMIVAGDHARNDLAGEGPDSWASRIRAEGLRVEPVLRGLGEYAGVQQLVCNHANAALLRGKAVLRG